MDKFTIARALDEISRYIELTDPQPFRARAFEKAARAVENIDQDLDDLVASGALTSVSGIGKATAQVIEELVRTGSAQYLDELRGQFPPGIFELLRIDEALEDLIAGKARASVIREQAVAGGMRTLREDGLRKAERGVTTLEEVLRVT